MSFLTRLFGKGKKKINLQVTEVGEEKPEPKPEGTGTTLRKPVEAPASPEKKEGPELTALEMAQRKDWKIKSLPEWKPGDVILGTYEVEDVISGGMGHVYIANHNKWNVKLAIKSPNEMMLSDRDFFARILREANSWTELGLHPNIAYCYYVRNIEDIPHIVVEYVDGGNLRQWIEDGKCIDYRTNLDLAIQFCHGMEYAHSKGMIHRDIKPENVLMTKDGTLKITDFGLVRSQGPGTGDRRSSSRDQESGVRSEEEGRKTVDHGLTTVGTFMGTPGYISPEQAESAHHVDERADIFSFGVCLYEMFCGNKPYDITYGPRQEPPNPNELSRDEDFPNDIGRVLTMSVQWDPSARYKNFKDIRQELARIYADLYGEQSTYAEFELLDLEADGLNNRGVSFFDLGRKEDAHICWVNALETNQAHIDATYNLSLIQWRDGLIDDQEVLSRLENTGNNPSTDKEKLAKLKAFIQAERLNLDAARDVLKELPGSYDDLFSGETIGNIRTRIMEGYSGYHSSSFTPDSRYVVSVDHSNTPWMWEIETGKCVRTLEGHTQSIRRISICPDGKYAVSGSDDKTIKVWNLENGRCVHTLSGSTGLLVYTIAISPDGRYVVVGYFKNFQMWELQTGKFLHTLEGHTDFTESFVFSPDSRLAVSGSKDNTLRVWELATGQCVHILEGHSHQVNSVAITPDGRYAVSGSWDDTLRMWELATGQCVHTLEGHSGGVNLVAITPDSRYAVSGSLDQTLRMWELVTGQCLRTMEGHTVGVTSLSLTPDGRYAVSGSEDRTYRLWELDTGRCVRTLKGQDRGYTVSFSPNGRYAVSKNSYETLRVLEFESGPFYQSQLVVSSPKGFEQRQKDNKHFINAVRKAKELYKSGDFAISFEILYRAWEKMSFIGDNMIEGVYSKLILKGRPKGLIYFFQKKILEGHTKRVETVCLTPDGRCAVSGSWDQTLRVWDIETGLCLRIFEGHKEGHRHAWVESVALTPDGRYAVSGCMGDSLRVWDIETGLCLRTLEGHNSGIGKLSITPDGRYAVSGNNDQTVRVWELETGRCVKTLEGHTAQVRKVAVSPDGRKAVSCSFDNTIRVWELETGRCLHTMEGHTGYVYTVSLSPDGQYAVSGSGDKTIRLWDLKTGQCLRILEGHNSGIWELSITPDGRYAVSGTDNRPARHRVWNLETGECMRTLEGQKWSMAICFSPDGRKVLSGYGNTLRIWKLFWNFEFPAPVDFDEGVRPYLEIFLTLRNGKWTEDDFNKLIDELATQRGYGWVRPEGIRRELAKMTAEYKD
jgi:WD40 repeat protein